MDGNNFEQSNVNQNNVEQNNVEQTTYQYGQVIPVEPKLKKGKKAGIIVTVILAVVVVLLTIAALLFYKLVLQSPEARLAKGLANMTAEFSEGQNPVLQELNYAEIMEKMYTDPTSVNMSFNLTMPDLEEIGTIGMDMAIDTDYPKEQMRSQMVLSAYNVDFIKMDYSAIQNTVYMSLPDLVKDTYSLNLDSLGKDYNASVWKDMLGVEVAEDMTYDLFPERTTEGDEDTAGEELAKLQQEWQTLIDTIVIEDAGNVIEIERNGKAVRCKGVRIIIPAETVKQYMEQLQNYLLADEFMKPFVDGFMERATYFERSEVEEGYKEAIEEAFAMEVQDDVALCIYMDKKNKIVRMETDKKIKFTDSVLESLQISFDFTGEKRALDEVEGTIKLKTEDVLYKTTCHYDAEQTEDEAEYNWGITFANVDTGEEVVAGYTSEWQLADREFQNEFILELEGERMLIETAGALSDVVSGESFNLELKKAGIKMNEEEFLKVTGSFGVKPFTGEITEPANAIDAMSMSELDIYTLIQELGSSLGNLTSLIQ